MPSRDEPDVTGNVPHSNMVSSHETQLLFLAGDIKVGTLGARLRIASHTGARLHVSVARCQRTELVQPLAGRRIALQKTRTANRSNERVLHGNGLFGGDFLGQIRIAFERADNIVEEIAKLAGIRQAGLVAREHNIAVEADMRRPVLDFEAIQGGGFGLVLIGVNKAHDRLSCLLMLR
jgi:hypothetical protein